MPKTKKRTLVDAAQDPLSDKRERGPKREEPKSAGTPVWIILGAVIGGVIIGLVSSRLLRIGL